MSAQKHETGKNCIGLLHEKTDERLVADLSAAANYPIMDHMLDLVAVLFRRRGATR